MSRETIIMQKRRGRDTLRLVRGPEWREWIAYKDEWEPGWETGEPVGFHLFWMELGTELYVGEDETEARRIAREHLGEHAS